MSVDPRTIVFHGEVQLQAWGESSSAGAWVKFWLHAEDLEHFKALRARSGKQAGQRLAAVMVEIGDDELPVVQEPPKQADTYCAPGAQSYQPHVGPLGMLAVRWCRDPNFQRWVAMQKFGADAQPIQEAGAKDFILSEANVYLLHGVVASRKHLDTDPACAQRFQECIRGPFMAWKREQGIE